MKKFVIAIDGFKYSAATVRSAIYYAQQSEAHLIGVFLDDVTYHNYTMSELVSEEGITNERMSEFAKRDDELRKTAVTRFEHACASEGLSYSIHHDRNMAIHELFHESVFADLVLIGCNETFASYREALPTRFLRSLLAEAQCPVLIIPETYMPLETVVFLYDGEPSSVHAIRTFGYLFPQLSSKTVEVVTAVSRSKQKPEVPQARLLKGFMKGRFPQTRYIVLEGDPEMELMRHLRFKVNTLVVCGAYRRGSVSRWFKDSLADSLMQEVNLPILIAHC